MTSQIEGTQATLTDLFDNEADPDRFSMRRRQTLRRWSRWRWCTSGSKPSTRFSTATADRLSR